jgi:hypothetical protein
MVTVLSREDAAGRSAWEFTDISRELGAALCNGVYYARLRIDGREFPAKIILHRAP